MEGGLRLQSRRAFLQHVIPQYREASTVKKKSKLLDAFTATTGYHRTYAMWLLNHAKEGQHSPQRPHYYGPEVQHALFLVWHAANRICAKRLIPFFPTLVEALERHEHLHLTEECRKQLLSMSAATADRLLRSQRKRGQRGLSSTRAGTLLKQQIPIRTFQEWKETRPGFLEADLVAHCGIDIEGGYLYTLTLTDVATGWTECLFRLCRELLSFRFTHPSCPHPRFFSRTVYSGKVSRRGEHPQSGSKARDLVPRAGAEKTGLGLAAPTRTPWRESGSRSSSG